MTAASEVRTAAWARDEAVRYIDELSQDALWRPHVQQASSVFYGSWCKGYGDELSDIDILLCLPLEQWDAAYRQAIECGRIGEGESIRLNGGNGAGGRFLQNCKLRSFPDVELELRHDLAVALWVFRGCSILNDPGDRLSRLLDRAEEEFRRSTRALMQGEFASLHRLRNWLGLAQTEERAASVPFIAVSIARSVLQCASLVEGLPYPYEKWLVPWTRSSGTLSERAIGQVEKMFDHCRDPRLCIDLADELIAHLQERMQRNDGQLSRLFDYPGRFLDQPSTRCEWPS